MARSLRARFPFPEPPAVTRSDRLFDLALAGVLAAVLLPSGLGSVAGTHLTGIWSVLLPLDLVVLHAALAVRRSWLRVSFLVVSGAMLLLTFAPDVVVTGGLTTSGISPLLLPSSMVFFFSLEAVTAYGAVPLPFAGLTVGALGGALSVVKLWDAPDYGNPIAGVVPWRLLVVGVVVAGLTAAWALGRYRATRVAWMATLEERARRAEADRRETIERARIELDARAAQAAAAERRRIAREMHDVIAHSLAVVVSHAEAGRLVTRKATGKGAEKATGKGAGKTVEKGQEQVEAVFTTIAEVGRDALTEMRGLLGLLRDDDSPDNDRVNNRDNDRDNDGDGRGTNRDDDRANNRVSDPENGHAHATQMRPGPQPSLRQLDSLLETVRGAGTPVKLQVDGRPVKLSHTSDLTAYRVIQEALTNVVKHAGAGAGAQLQLTWADQLEIVVTDDGRDAAPPASAGRGITGMRERLEHVGGSLDYAGPLTEGDGFRVRASIPLSAAKRGEGDP